MIKTELVSVEKEVFVFITCDKCKKEFIAEQDVFEIQEFHHIHFTGGYASIFGDTSTVRCDICQHCLKELIGGFCRIDEDVREME